MPSVRADLDAHMVLFRSGRDRHRFGGEFMHNWLPDRGGRSWRQNSQCDGLRERIRRRARGRRNRRCGCGGNDFFRGLRERFAEEFARFRRLFGAVGAPSAPAEVARTHGLDREAVAEEFRHGVFELRQSRDVLGNRARVVAHLAGRAVIIEPDREGLLLVAQDHRKEHLRGWCERVVGERKLGHPERPLGVFPDERGCRAFEGMQKSLQGRPAERRTGGLWRRHVGTLLHRRMSSQRKARPCLVAPLLLFPTTCSRNFPAGRGRTFSFSCSPSCCASSRST